MVHRGSCHCGGVRYEVEGEPDSAMACNCSICTRKGSLLWFVPHQRFRLLTPQAQLATYTFNPHVIKHRFCPSCGIHTHGEGVDPSGQAMAAVNLRTLEDLDLASVPVKHFDGRAL